MSRVFRVEVEVGHMKGCQLPEEAAGAFVNVYVSAAVLRDALDLAERFLIEDHYRPIDIYAAFELDLEGIDHDTEEVGYPGNADLQELQLHGGRWYGPFTTFPYEDEEPSE
ncbi:hypothetical protein OKA05_29065 [Luteolibacter arcticus]|uniref:Uncharacterized protein n=1 Tax=Luteolibacter arcticus TaxID=1581411 RepID=A0ABT3GSX9_9BACT|nr:hypothetical protein [Luteolibacter arcticus]MCW1926639.1 hypothetical protein [Luteolibacter arcticus]